MEKKVRMSKVSLKIAKGGKKKRLRTISPSLIKVLRPRVYITEASDFKRLIQELTGNCSQQLPQQPMPDARNCLSTTTVISSDDQVSSSLETRASDDFAGILEPGGAAAAIHFTREVPPAVPLMWHPQQIQVHEQQVDEDEILMTFGDIEGWLMDIDSVMPSFERYVTPEVGICNFVMGDL